MRARSARSRWVGLLVAAASVAAITGLIFALRPVVPVLSTGVLYLVAVLLVSGYWGLWLGLLTAAASALAFNFFHIPPTGHFEISKSENFVGLAVYLLAAIVVSALAEATRARKAEAERRQREADLALELAMILLGGGDDALEEAGERIRTALGLDGARLEADWVAPERGERAVPLLAGGRRVGTVMLPADASERATRQVEQRLAPAIGALMGARERRRRLEERLLDNEALRRSETLKTALLRAASHDFRSPLTAITAAAAGIDSATLTAAERTELKEVISGEAERLSSLVANLLDLSRLESGSLETNAQPSSIEEIIEAAAYGPALRGARLDVQLDDDLPLVDADPAQLERAVSNLLENAVRHSSGAPVAVRAHTQGSRFVLRITDQGPGIAKEELERIFEPFYRGANAGGTGSGLGLAIAKGLVEANRGRLWARSLAGQGATFGVDLPIAKPAATTAAP